MYRLIGSLKVDTMDEVVSYTEKFVIAGVQFSCGRDGSGWVFEFHVKAP